ncbi:MAG: tetratricopeptide repeat protein [Bernardetiaceae bacterium]|nr:tetratricopeptide repeat protein [Bernardetiaceae bacterium]
MRFIILVVFLLFSSFYFSKGVCAQPPHDIEQTVDIFQSGNFRLAQKRLEENLKHNPKDRSSRLILGFILSYLGKNEKAIATWEAGLDGTDNDYSYYMSIAEVREKQAKEEPFFSQLPESLQDTPYNFFRTLAIEAYSKAHALYPYQTEPIEELARLHQDEEQYDDAIAYLTMLAELYPEKDLHQNRIGFCYLLQEKTEEALLHFEKAESLNPYNGTTYKGKALCYDQMENQEAQKIYNDKYMFYDAIPKFITLEFSPKRYEQLNHFLMLGMQEQNFYHYYNKRNRFFDSLITTLPFQKQNAELLAIAYWNDLLVEEELEQVIQYLSQDPDEYGIWLLLQIAAPCKQVKLSNPILQWIGINKPPGAFRFLIDLFEKEERNAQLQISEALVLLQDDLAVPYWAKRLEWAQEYTTEIPQFVQPRVVSRIKAALALGYFDMPLAHEALQKGLQKKAIRVFCAAALYRLTQKTEYLAIIQNFAKKGGKSLQLANYISDFDDKKTKRIAKKLRY